MGGFLAGKNKGKILQRVFRKWDIFFGYIYERLELNKSSKNKLCFFFFDQSDEQKKWEDFSFQKKKKKNKLKK